MQEQEQEQQQQQQQQEQQQSYFGCGGGADWAQRAEPAASSSESRARLT